VPRVHCKTDPQVHVVTRSIKPAACRATSRRNAPIDGPPRTVSGTIVGGRLVESGGQHLGAQLLKPLPSGSIRLRRRVAHVEPSSITDRVHGRGPPAASACRRCRRLSAVSPSPPLCAVISRAAGVEARDQPDPASPLVRQALALQRFACVSNAMNSCERPLACGQASDGSISVDRPAAAICAPSAKPPPRRAEVERGLRRNEPTRDRSLLHGKHRSRRRCSVVAWRSDGKTSHRGADSPHLRWLECSRSTHDRPTG